MSLNAWLCLRVLVVRLEVVDVVKVAPSLSVNVTVVFGQHRIEILLRN